MLTPLPTERWLSQHNARTFDKLAQERMERFVREQLGATDND